MEWTEVEVVKGGLNGKAVEEHKQSDDKKVVNVKDLDVNQLKQIGSMKWSKKLTKKLPTGVKRYQNINREI